MRFMSCSLGSTVPARDLNVVLYMEDAFGEPPGATYSLGSFAGQLTASVECGCAGPREGRVHGHGAHLFNVLADYVFAVRRLSALVLRLGVGAERQELVWRRSGPSRRSMRSTPSSACFHRSTN